MKAFAPDRQYDLNVYLGNSEFSYPCPQGFPGEAGSGIIESLGRGVDSLSIGDRVIVMTDDRLQESHIYMEKVIRKAFRLFKCPNNISFEEMVILELASCSNKAVRRAESATGGLKGKRIGVAGLGPAGILTLQLLQMHKPDILVGIEVLPNRQIFPIHYGIDCYNPDEQNQIKKLKDLKLQVLIDCSGNSFCLQNSFELSQEIVVIFGVINEEIYFTPSSWHRKELIVINSRMQNTQDLEAVLKLYNNNKLQLNNLITAVYSIEEYAKAIEHLKTGEIHKVILQSWS
jgi:threonine dehydrogenase-like Zn-dependent dehydrogenase